VPGRRVLVINDMVSTGLVARLLLVHDRGEMWLIYLVALGTASPARSTGRLGAKAGALQGLVWSGPVRPAGRHQRPGQRDRAGSAEPVRAVEG
jgi:hypothetical protein